MTSVLLTCSGGGHLKQLFTIADRVGVAPDDQVWATFDNALSRSLLEGRRVHYVPFAAPRDALNIVKIRMHAHRILAEHDFTAALSTGSSPAVAFLPLTARRGIPSHYIESAARADGPSLSGRLIARNRRIQTYTQYPGWADDRWLFHGSIFDAYAPGETAPARPLRRAVVSVGTQEGYGFDRLYRALVPLLAQCEEVLWQTGGQDVSGYGIAGRASVPHDELKHAVAAADVVIAHSGVGAALTAIEHGKAPVLVPRLARFGEHIDDHQLQIGTELERRGLASMVHASDLTADDLAEAARRTVVPVPPPPFTLAGFPARRTG